MKILIGSIGSVLILILVSLTNVVCSDLITSNEKKEQIAYMEFSHSYTIKSIPIQYFLVELKTIIKMILTQYTYPNIESICQGILRNLDILFIQWPVAVCLMILTLSEALFDLSDLI